VVVKVVVFLQSATYRDCYPDADLDAEYVVCGSTQFWVLAHVSVEVHVVYIREILKEMPLHAVEGLLIDKAVVRDKANNSVPSLEPVRGPPEELHIRVVQLGL